MYSSIHKQNQSKPSLPSRLFKGQKLGPTSNDSFFPHVINIYMPTHMHELLSTPLCPECGHPETSPCLYPFMPTGH